MPFENSTNGQVVFTYDLLRDWFMPSDRNKKPASFKVVAEQFVSIHHYLLSNASDLSKITTLYSHPQVWGQVTQFLSLGKLPEKYTTVDVSSTAQAAANVYSDKSNTSACICSKMSADLYQLPVKFAEIEDFKGNTTRFLVLGYGARLPVEKPESGPTLSITSFLFILNLNDPGALCSALDSFKHHKVNLTSINSRPSRQTQWQYVFFVEAEGDETSERIQGSIQKLHDYCTDLVVLGSFARSWRYK